MKKKSIYLLSNLWWLIPLSIILLFWQHSAPILLMLIFAYLGQIILNPAVSIVEKWVGSRRVSVFTVILGLIILLVLNFQRKINSYVKLLNYYFIFNIIYILCTYFLIDAEIEFVVRTTMERLIFTSSGFYVFLIVTFVKNLNKNLIKG